MSAAFGNHCQQGTLAPIGNPEPKEFAIPLESQGEYDSAFRILAQNYEFILESFSRNLIDSVL